MPRRLSNPFSGQSSSPSDKGPRPATASKRLSFWPLRSLKPAESQTANSPHITPANLPLPTISLSTATANSANMDEPATTLFQPPSAIEARRLAKQHAQFAPLASQAHRHVSQYHGGDLPDPIEDEPPHWVLLTTYLSYLVLIVFGHVLDFFGKLLQPERFSHLREHAGYAPWVSDFESFYVRRLKTRLDDCFARPTTGVPGRYITLLDRKSDDYNETLYLTGTTTETLNISSYNYLGFAQSEGPCADYAEEVIRKYGVSMASTRALGGTSDLHHDVESQVAKFVGKEAAMMFSMGYVTNTGVLPALVSKGSLILSDELNHASIRTGARLSGAMVDSFKHNSMQDLERKLRLHISQGQPRTHRPWKNILLLVEGLYSMEGTLVALPAILRLKKKYKFRLWVDEAHSVGAIGPRGRGVCDYFGVDPAEIDILMGTFTKSFGANGGYVAADKATIDKLRLINAGTIYAESPTPYVLAQISSALRIITGELVPGQGMERVERLAFNSRYLRLGLKRLGFIVYGHDDSPVIPMLVYHPAKMPAFSREMLRRKISVVVVGYPATPLITSRVRFCVSAAHNKDDLDRILVACDEVGDAMQLKYSSGIAGGQHYPQGEVLSQKEVNQAMTKRKLEDVTERPRWSIEEVLRRGVQDAKIPLR